MEPVMKNNYPVENLQKVVSGDVSDGCDTEYIMRELINRTREYKSIEKTPPWKPNSCISLMRFLNGPDDEDIDKGLNNPEYQQLSKSTAENSRGVRRDLFKFNVVNNELIIGFKSGLYDDKAIIPLINFFTKGVNEEVIYEDQAVWALQIVIFGMHSARMLYAENERFNANKMVEHVKCIMEHVLKFLNADIDNKCGERPRGGPSPPRGPTPPTPGMDPRKESSSSIRSLEAIPNEVFIPDGNNFQAVYASPILGMDGKLADNRNDYGTDDDYPKDNMYGKNSLGGSAYAKRTTIPKKKKN